MLTLAGQLKARVADFKMGKGQSVALAGIVFHADPLVVKKESVKRERFIDAAPVTA